MNPIYGYDQVYHQQVDHGSIYHQSIAVHHPGAELAGSHLHENNDDENILRLTAATNHHQPKFYQPYLNHPNNMDIMNMDSGRFIYPSMSTTSTNNDDIVQQLHHQPLPSMNTFHQPYMWDSNKHSNYFYQPIEQQQRFISNQENFRNSPAHEQQQQQLEQLDEHQQYRAVHHQQYIKIEHDNATIPTTTTASTIAGTQTPTQSSNIHTTMNLNSMDVPTSTIKQELEMEYHELDSNSSSMTNTIPSSPTKTEKLKALRIKSHNCPDCNKWFTSSGHLKRHQKTAVHKNSVKTTLSQDSKYHEIDVHTDEKTSPPYTDNIDQYNHYNQHHQQQHQPAYNNYDNQGSSPTSLFDLQHVDQHQHQHQQQQQEPQQSFNNFEALPQFGSFHYNAPPNQNYQLLATAIDNNSPTHLSSTSPSMSSLHSPTISSSTVTSTSGLLADVAAIDQPSEIEIKVNLSSSKGKNKILTTAATATIPSPAAALPSDVKIACIECCKAFSKTCYLTQHNKVFHSGEHPFRCQKCGKRFQSEQVLDTHMAKHMATDKPFKCDLCPKQFHYRTDLRRHRDGHTGHKLHVCDICNKGFCRKDHLCKHRETHKPKPLKN